MGRERKKKAVIPLTYGDALKLARTKKKWTTEELAGVTKIDNSSISKYESGQQLPPESKNEILEKKLKTSLRKEWEAVKPHWDSYLKKKRVEQKARQSGLDNFDVAGYIREAKQAGTITPQTKAGDNQNLVSVSIPTDIRTQIEALKDVTGATIEEMCSVLIILGLQCNQRAEESENRTRRSDGR